MFLYNYSHYNNLLFLRHYYNLDNKAVVKLDLKNITPLYLLKFNQEK